MSELDELLQNDNFEDLGGSQNSQELSHGVTTPTPTPTLDVNASHILRFGMRENTTGGISADPPPNWLLSDVVCSVLSNPVKRISENEYKVYVNRQLSAGTWNGRADWFAMLNEEGDDVGDAVVVGCLNPYKNRCTHKVKSVDVDATYGEIDSGYFYGNWRITFTNSENFDVDGNGKFVWVDQVRYILYKWGSYWVLRSPDKHMLHTGPTSGTISEDVQETEIEVEGTSELLNNGDFYSLQSGFLTEIPSEWVSVENELLEYTLFDQIKLRQGIVKLQSGSPSFWIRQIMDIELIENKRYLISIENLTGSPVRVRFKNTSGTRNSNILWESVDGVDVGEWSYGYRDIITSAVITLSSAENIADSFDIRIDATTEISSVSLQGVVLPDVGSDVILPLVGGGIPHEVISKSRTSFTISGVYPDLTGTYIAYDNCAGHVVSKYNLSKGWQDYDEYRYWVSENMTTLTSFPYEPNSPKYFLDYVILKYPRFNDLM